MPRLSLTEMLAVGPVLAPTAYDMLAARIIEQSGFAAVFCSGYGQAASALGAPDTGVMPLDLLVMRVEAMAAAVDVPVIADADTGYGDPGETVRRLATAGAAGVMIDDQVAAKRCGHLAGKSVVSSCEMLERLGAANSARPAGLVLIARTDARVPLGIEEALARGRAYADAGADVVFVEAPQTKAELRRVAAELPCHAMANILPGGRTPHLPFAELAELGFRLVVFGLLDLMLATAALRDGFEQLAATGSIETVTTPRLSFTDLNRLTGLSRALNAEME